MAPALRYFLLFLTTFLCPLRILAQNTGSVTLQTVMTATENSDPWRSPSGDFAFGFQQLRDNKDQFVLGIWFDKIPDKTIVWYDSRSYPVPRGSTVQLTGADGLVLLDPQGRLLYNTEGLTDTVVDGFMNDTGNFVLRGSSMTLWESFRNPSDTILPTQTIKANGRLISRKSETNFSPGRFYATVNPAGDFVFRTKSSPLNWDFDNDYYSSLTSDPNASNSGYQVVFSESGAIFVLRRNGDQVFLTLRSIPPIAENYYRATLNFYGLFTHYYHPRSFSGNPGWTATRSWPENICLQINDKGSGACGYNSVCMLENQTPICRCPQGYNLSDPGEPYGDCKPNFEPSCAQGTATDEYDMREIHDTDWPLNDFEEINPSTRDQCRSACLDHCFCAVSIHRNNSCWKKKLPLSNGRVDSTLGATAFLKFRKGDAPFVNPNQPPHVDKPKRDQQSLVLVFSVLLGSSVFVNVLFVLASCLGFFLIYKKKKIPVLNLVRDAPGTNVQCYTYKELVQVTNEFKEEVGRGAFGIVYKGVIPHRNETMVAVKKLDRVFQDSEKEFRTEVDVIGRTHHKNLVRLVGYCDEGPNRLLVYEYMPNGTLASFLFGDSRPSWSQRTKIASGVARGLTYLHEECISQIIHCDIKPQNILLDEYHHARISDFGLAKLLMMNQSRTLTNIRGTKGYVAPEWFRNTQVTAKVDVYSFGVLLLEIITCRKSLDRDVEIGEGENPILSEWVWDCFAEGRLDTLVGNDEEALSDAKTMVRYVRVGIWCIQEDASLRPSMRKVCQMLEGIVEVAVPPCPWPLTSL